MVNFTCQNCGDSVNKPGVAKHYQISKCRYKRPHLCCSDCLKDFFDQEYNTHTECMTEMERYSAKGTVFKAKAGKEKQKKYVNMIQNLLNSKDLAKNHRKLLEILSKYDNVPRKQPKFVIFWFTHSEKPLRMARYSTAKIFGANVEESLTLCEPDDQEYRIDTGRDSLRNFMKNIDRKAKLEDLQSVFKLLENSFAKQTNASAATLVSENIGDESNVMDQSCDKPKNVKCNKTNGTDQLEEGEENVTNANTSIDESKENENGMSKKELKKLKKHKKYLLELENVEKSNVVGTMEFEESAKESGEKRSKKFKKTKLKPDQIDSPDNGVTEKKDAMEVNMEEEIVTKKHKKRKLVDTTPEVAEKKNRMDSLEGGEEEEGQQTFNWAEVIVKVLQNRADNELSLKQLGKKVVNEYQAVKSDHHTYEQLLAKFNKKVKKTAGVRVLKDKAKLIG